MIEPIYIAIGHRIAMLRERRGLTQEMLGASMTPPHTRASISNIENGHQRIMVAQLVDIADDLHTSPGALLRNLKALW